MALTNSQYNTLMRAYEERQLTNRQILEERQNYVNKTIPRYGELSSQISSLSLEYASRLLDGDESALTDMKRAISSLREEKCRLLAEAGLPADRKSVV